MILVNAETVVCFDRHDCVIVLVAVVGVCVEIVVLSLAAIGRR
jgi:hypothetical protein